MKKHNLFNDSKYTRWYWAIIEKRAITDRRRKGEVHHIIPQSLGGTDDQSNLVKLSGHDHAWCHWLLTKMTSGEVRAKMVYAFNMMGVYGEHMEREKSYAIVRAYEKNRLEWSKVHSKKMQGKEPWNKGKTLDDEKYKKAGRSNKGRTLAPEVAEAKRLRQIGSKRSDKTRQLMSEQRRGVPKGPMSELEKKKRSITLTGKAKPIGHGENVAAAVIGNISINRDGVEKKVKQPDLQSWLDAGWALGGRPRGKRQAA